MADLNSMLTDLDDAKIAQEIENRVDMVLKRFPVPAPIVPKYADAEVLALRLYQAIMQDLFHASVSDKLARGQVAMLFARAFPGGVEDAADMATTGVNGGVLAVLYRLSDSIKKQLVEQYVSGTISGSCDLSDWDDRVDLADKYLKRFSPNLSANKRQKTAQELASRIPEYIRSHMQIMSWFRKHLGK